MPENIKNENAPSQNTKKNWTNKDNSSIIILKNQTFTVQI